MAAFFGTSLDTDAWLMASVLPNLLFGAINGAITITVVPLLTEGEAQYSHRSVQRFINEVFTSVVLVSLILIVLGEVFAAPILHLVAPGFHGREFRLAVSMTRIMVPTILFWGLAGLLVGILQEQEDYFNPALSPVAINAVRIATIIVLGHFWHIQGVAVGFTLAVFSQLLVTWPALRRHGFHLHLRWHFSHPLLRRMIVMSGPFFLTSSVGTLGVIVDRILASNLATGSIAALNYAYVLVQIPVGLVISSLATPIYTRLSQHHSLHDSETFRDLAMKGFRVVTMVIVPITIWFIVLRIPLLRLLYQHGAFNAHSTSLTAGTLLYFAIGLPGFGLSFYLQRLFFATHDTRSPARFSIITIIVNIVGDLILVRVLNVDGLALATALAAMVNATLLTVKALRPRARAGRVLNRMAVTLGLSSAAMVASTYVMRHLLTLDTLGGILPLSLGLIAVVLVSGAVFIACLGLFRFPEVVQARRYILRRLGHLPPG